MRGIFHTNVLTTVTRHFVSGVRNCDICSFTEFYPFCPKLYYFSTFKAYRMAA